MVQITVFNEKGGVGKTTVAVLLATLLDAEIIDQDDQKTASRWLARRPEPRQVSPGRWVIDCAPGLSMDSANAVKDARLIVVPVTVSFPSFDALPQTLRFIRAHSTAKICFVGVDVDSRTSDLDTLKAALKTHGAPLAGVLTHRASYRRAGLTGGLAGDSDVQAATEQKTLIKEIVELLK